MNLFFTTDIKDGYAQLNEEESGHCIRVLRMRAGDEIAFVDGVGGFYKGILEIADSKKCTIKIEEAKHDYGKRKYSLHIAIAPTKNIERLEWFLEKATEIGIDEITPIICKHSERRIIKEDRLRKVIQSAMKQSLKAYLPKLNPSVEFSKFISASSAEQKFIGQMSAESLLSKVYKKEKGALILIGPEGDFSEEEITLANKNGFISVSFGESRLRTETSGVVAASLISLLNQ